MSERFESDWLALREPADADARDGALVRRAANWLANRPAPLCITDLGAGSGANPRFLTRYLPGPQRWRLVDHDPDLLRRAAERVSQTRDENGNPIEFETCRQDLANADAAVSGQTDLATASALFDLVSADWIDALAARCAAVGCAALWALSVDGDWHFIDPGGKSTQDATDLEMLSLLRAHQAREKGLGRALGGSAPGVLRAAFAKHGYAIAEAPSPWRLLAGGHRPLALALLDGWREALLEQAPRQAPKIKAWRRERGRDIEAGRLGIEVGHIDLYAEPRA